MAIQRSSSYSPAYCKGEEVFLLIQFINVNFDGNQIYLINGEP